MTYTWKLDELGSFENKNEQFLSPKEGAQGAP